MSAIMHEPTPTHPDWCAASECVPSPVLDDFEHRSTPRAITMEHVAGTMCLSHWGADPDVEIVESNLTVQVELENVAHVEQLLLMLSPAEARTFAAELLALAGTAEGGAR
jgi:hypothetical protein